MEALKPEAEAEAEWREEIDALVVKYAAADGVTQAGIVAIVEEDWGDAAGETLAEGFEAAREQKVIKSPIVGRVYRREGSRQVAVPVTEPEPEPEAVEPRAAPAPEVEAGAAEAVPETEPPKERAARSEFMDLDDPFGVARHFLFDHYSLGGVTTLRWWQGGWREWTGTHYAEKEEDALQAELYAFLDKARTGRFQPNRRHVNELVGGIKARTPSTARLRAARGSGKASRLGALSRSSVARTALYG